MPNCGKPNCVSRSGTEGTEGSDGRTALSVPALHEIDIDAALACVMDRYDPLQHRLDPVVAADPRG